MVNPSAGGAPTHPITRNPAARRGSSRHIPRPPFHRRMWDRKDRARGVLPSLLLVASSYRKPDCRDRAPKHHGERNGDNHSCAVICSLLSHDAVLVAKRCASASCVSYEQPFASKRSIDLRPRCSSLASSPCVKLRVLRAWRNCSAVTFEFPQQAMSPHGSLSGHLSWRQSR